MVQGSSYAPNQSVAGFSITPTERDVYRSIGDWLKSVIPAGCYILQGQQNQTPQPIGLNATMQLISRKRIATNNWTYDTKSGTRTVIEQTQVTVQVNVFGSQSGNAVHQVHALWRDFYTTDFMRNEGSFICPLYATDPRQMGFVTKEDQYEDGWSVDLHMQVNFEITTPQQFADTVTVPIVEADTLT